MKKPTVFIGSAKASLDIADAVAYHLRETALVSVWADDGLFVLSQATLDSLLAMPDNFDFAILVLTPDDLSLGGSANRYVPRDNVMFEFGLFMGALGRSRTLAICSDDPSLILASDLAGITVARFGHEDATHNLMAAIRPACIQLRNIIRQLGPRFPIDDAVSLIEFNCIPEQPIRGGTLILEFVLESKIKELRVWFGANLFRDDKYIYDVDEDSEQILARGRRKYLRYLSIPARIEPGTYLLRTEVWFGERSNPDRSRALVGLWPARTLILS